MFRFLLEDDPRAGDSIRRWYHSHRFRNLNRVHRLRRQGLLPGVWCIDPNEVLSPGQAEEITRVHDAYPHLHDDDFVRANLARWLAD